MNDQQIKALKPKDGKQYTVSGLGVAGLSLAVSYAGTKAFYFRYRSADGKQKRIKLGTYPALSLAKAKSKALQYTLDVSEGADPVAEKKADKFKKLNREIKSVGELWLDYREKHGLKKRSAEFEEIIWRKHLSKTFDRLDIDEFTRTPIKLFLNRARQEKSASLANRCQSLITRLATHGVDIMMFDQSPAHNLGKRPVEQSRDRALNQDELTILWNALHNPDALKKAQVSVLMAQAVKFCTLTLCRRSEVAGAKWVEIDRAAATFTLPKERTKNKRKHIVPLVPQTIQVLELAQKYSTKQNEYVFPSPQTDRHIIGSAITRACSRLSDSLGLEAFRPHDLRRTGVTTLVAEPFRQSRFILSRAINHLTERGGASAMFASYDANQYLPEIREALTIWGAHLDNINS